MDRQELEKLWRDRVQNARLRLEFARNYLNEVEKDGQAGAIPAPDDRYAEAKAVLAENYALAEYHRVMQLYTALVLEGKLPDEEKDWLRRRGASDGKGA